MDIQFHSIQTTRDKIRLYRFRKQVFVDEEIRFSHSSDHISDVYDSIDETVNLAAFCNGRIVAALRVTAEGDAGLPVDAHWDFSAFRSSLSGSCASFGWLCCTRAFRHRKGLIKTLVKQGVNVAEKGNHAHILAVIHPPVYDILRHSFGVRQIAAPFRDRHLNLEMIPIHARVDEVLDRLDRSEYERPAPRRKTPDPGRRLKALGFRGKYHFMEQALSRNLGILSLAEQEKLMSARVAIPGLGGVGGQHLVTLVRSGIGRFHIADFDIFEPVNINRQYGARLSGMNRAKSEVMYREALDINPFLEIREFPGGVNRENLDDFLDGVDLVADAMDFFSIDIRRRIFNRARERKIPVITAGPLGFSAAMLIFMPDTGMDFDTYFNLHNALDTEEQLTRFFVGLAPRATQSAYIDPLYVSMKEKRGPSTGAGCQMCSGVLAAEAVRILLNRPGIKAAPYFFQYDPYTRQFIRGYLFMGNRHPLQRLKAWMVRRRLNRAILPETPPCPPVPETPPGNDMPLGSISHDILTYLIRAGCRAPSGDNVQPWSFSWKPPRLRVFLDPGADPSFFNVNQAATRIACGAAVENILLAAGRFGMSGTVTCLPDPAQPDLAAEIRLSMDHTPESPLQRFIWERHTNRTRFNGRPIPGPDMDRLNQSLTNFKDARLTLIEDRRTIRQIAGLVYEADVIRSLRRDLHTHFMKMIRFTPEAAMMTRDGLPLKNLEAGLAGEHFLRYCRPWPVMRLVNMLGLGRAIPRQSAQWACQSSAMGLISIRGKGPAQEITGGRALERLWLTATRLGISFQPLTAVTLFRIRWDLGMQDRFSMPHQQRLAGIWPLYDQLLDVRREDTPIMLFRLGYGRAVSCRTLRKYAGCGAGISQ